MQLTNEQIAEGWKLIESKEEIAGLQSSFFRFMDDTGIEHDAFNDMKNGCWNLGGLGDFTDTQVVLNFKAYRPITDNTEALAKLREEHDAWADNLISKNDELAMENAKLRAQLAEQPTLLRNAFILIAYDRMLKSQPWATAEDTAKDALDLADEMMKKCTEDVDAMLAQRKGENDG